MDAGVVGNVYANGIVEASASADACARRREVAAAVATWSSGLETQQL